MPYEGLITARGNITIRRQGPGRFHPESVAGLLGFKARVSLAECNVTSHGDESKADHAHGGKRTNDDQGFAMPIKETNKFF